MTRLKTYLFRLLPIFLLALATVVLGIVIYTEMIRDEEEDCWNVLSNACLTMSQTIENRFEGNKVLLDRVADALHMEAILDHDESVLDYLNKLEHTTMFSRIDVLYPDGHMLCQDGSILRDTALPAYQQLLADAPFLTGRTTDPRTAQEVLYYFTPIHSRDQIVGLLMGTIDCTTLRSQFTLNIYDGQAQVYLLDRTSGDFIINNWATTFVNLHQIGEHKLLPGYDAEPFIPTLLAGKTGRIAYRTPVSGTNTYMYMIPVNNFPWQLCIAVTEEIVFAKVFRLRTLLVTAGSAMFGLVLIYLACNAYIVYKAIRNEEKARQAEMERVGNAAKARFLSSVSHDIRTPLNGILGMLDVIRRRNYDPQQLQDSLHKIEVSARYLMTLANDVLDLNEIESTQIVLPREQVDLVQMLTDLEGLLLPRAKEHAVHCHFDATGIHHPCVMTSSVHIQRLLVNLITNAIKYNRHDGNVWVTAEEFRFKQHSSLYRFTVRDNGIGMTAEFQQNMFKAFEQEHGGARTIHQGHGLGLSIVQRLVDAMGGTIDVTSQKDVGSTFTVVLTLDHAPHALPSDAQLHPAEQPSDIHGMRLLVAEDNELNLEIALCLLEDAGAAVSPVKNGLDAVKAFDASDPFAFDAILMDVMMPEMDGIEAARTIRALSREDASQVPIIAMTASTFAEDVRRCREAGMDHHMAKPLNIDALLSLLAQERTRYAKVQRASRE